MCLKQHAHLIFGWRCGQGLASPTGCWTTRGRPTPHQSMASTARLSSCTVRIKNQATVGILCSIYKDARGCARQQQLPVSAFFSRDTAPHVCNLVDRRRESSGWMTGCGRLAYLLAESQSSVPESYDRLVLGSHCAGSAKVLGLERLGDQLARLAEGVAGHLEIWRNGKLVLPKQTLSTAYDDPKAPYLKFGVRSTAFSLRAAARVCVRARTCVCMSCKSHSVLGLTLACSEVRRCTTASGRARYAHHLPTQGRRRSPMVR